MYLTGRECAAAMNLLRHPFLRFLLVGGVNTLFGWAAFALLVTLGVHYAFAAALSTIASIVFNFFSTGTLVFRQRDPRLFPRFLAVYGICWAVLVLVLRAADRAGVDTRLAGLLFAFPQALLAYALQRAFVFTRRDGAAR